VKQFWSLDSNIQLKRGATSFPRHLREWANLRPNSGIFVILSDRMAFL